ncbi:MAG: hypothetical protein ABI614_19235 [Planctomycetota bacterium]
MVEFTDAQLAAPKPLADQLAELVCKMFDGTNPVRTKDAAKRLGRNTHTFKTHLRRSRLL